MGPLPDLRPRQNWFFRYRLYHIPFWIVYHYIWWTVAVGNPLKAASTILFSFFAVKFLFYVVFQALAVYFNLYYLIPKYLQKGRINEYIIWLFITIACASALIVPGYFLSAFASGKTMKELYGDNCIYQFLGNSLPSTLASMTLAMSIKLTKNWLQTEQRHQQLEKEKLETELKFLKYQINPHFLFNSINSIFFLIHKNPDMASASLAKFSDLLRYQLYECNDLQIPLAKEIGYLENFIELERLRQNRNVAVTIELDPRHTGHLGVAPFILMTFVENAFKHVSRHDDRANWINIRLHLDTQHLDFTVSNSASYDMPSDLIAYSGIGLTNVRRRLDLIYPGQYELEIREGDSDFDVKLRLTLSELAMPKTILQTA